MDESAAKVSLDKTDESSELADLQNEIANLIEEKEAAIRQQDFEAAARLRIKEKKLTQQLTEVAFMEVKKRQAMPIVFTAEDVATVVSNGPAYLCSRWRKRKRTLVGSWKDLASTGCWPRRSGQSSRSFDPPRPQWIERPNRPIGSSCS